MADPTAPRPVSVESPGNDGFRYEPAPERHDPPADATCGERIAILGTAHACRWPEHNGHSHACVCGVRWEPRELGCATAPVADQPGRRYRLSLEFGAADDRQAHRLGMAWAGTCAAEYNTCNPIVTPVAPVTAEDLRDRLAGIIQRALPADYHDGDHPVDCAACTPVVNEILAALAGDPGDLPAILVERLKDIPTGVDGLECRIPDRRHREVIAAVAVSVCWEDRASTVARLAQAEAQVAAIRTLITEDYGDDYGDEDVPAAVERLMRHLSEHEANVQRLRQSKNEALERAEIDLAEMQTIATERSEACAVAESEVERLRAENGLLRIRAAGADTRNDLLSADLAEARQRQAASDETVAVRAYQQVKAQRDRALAEVERLQAELAEERDKVTDLRQHIADLRGHHDEWVAAAQDERDALKAAIERVWSDCTDRLGYGQATAEARIFSDGERVQAERVLNILATLAAPESPGAKREGCDDPDCSRTECLHLGTCWEDAMDPPETTPDAPTGGEGLTP